MLYAEGGQAAVTFESVSKRADVGKPALYRRWASAPDLLIDALRRTDFALQIRETGDLRTELIAFTAGLMDYFASPDGPVVIRMMIEVQRQSPLHAAVGDVAAEHTLHAAEAIIQRGLDRGELDADVSATMLTGLLAGAALYESLARRDGTTLSTPGTNYAADLVDFLLGRARR